MLVLSLICLLLFTLYGLLVDYYRRAWMSIPHYITVGNHSHARSARISVLVPARNEEKNIGKCLDSLSRQSYPKDLYEVIVIDDHSTDRTWEILHARHDADLRLTALRLTDQEAYGGPAKPYKKMAIESGIQAATGNLIVTTDADCRFHPDWLSTIAGFREETGATFIAAPVKIDAGHSFLSIFQTLDFIMLQGITGAAVHKKFHSMCNGANLAYEKKSFYEVEGFRDIDDIPSGDDMFLMHKIFTKYPDRVFFLKNPQATVSTNEAGSWREFINQRIRWASKADRYDDKRIFWVLLLVYFLNLLFPIVLLASFWNGRYLWIGLILLIAKTSIEFPFVRSVAVFFDQRRLLAWFPLMQPFHILYTIGIGWLGKFGSYRWKDRKV
jgi:cellulose synthase/poly-beta-1,6-N-acetylglucosamine synthase-like glycosyltransferase